MLSGDSASDHDFNKFKGRVFIESAKSTHSKLSFAERYIGIPRSKALILDTSTGLRLGEHQMSHGEAETRFVSVFKNLFILSCTIEVGASLISRTKLVLMFLTTSILALYCLMIRMCS